MTTSDQGENLAELRKKLANQPSRHPWRGLEELAETPEFMEMLQQEFPRQASIAQALSRREFLKLLAAPLALAGLSACVAQPREKILPYTDAPEALVPGRPMYFATAFEIDGYAQGVVVESHEGRPTKVEGNPMHPVNQGATDVFAQASILNLYDPDRAQTVSNQGAIRTWEDFQSVITSALEKQRASGGAGLRLLTGTVTSPTLARQIFALLEAYPQARWYQYDALDRATVRQGAEMAFGKPVETRYSLEKADVILSLDADFTQWMPGSLRLMREFAARRQVLDGQGTMNRLYVVESSLTGTGAAADHRQAVKPSQVASIARAIAQAIGVGAGSEGPADPWAQAAAGDLAAHKGASLVMVGPQQPAEVHALAHAMNAALGNIGSTVFYTEPVEAIPEGGRAGLGELAQELDAGTVQLLVVLGGDPVFTAPADLEFSEKYRKASLRVYLGSHEDETAALSQWHIPAAHYLEMWSDTRSVDGTVSIVQPLIEPLFGGKSPHELLALMGGQPGANGYDLVRATWQELFANGNVQPQPALTSRPILTDSGITVVAPRPDTQAGEEAQPGVSPAATPATPATPSPAETAAPTQAAPSGTAGQAPDPAFERFWRRALRDGMIPGTEAPAAQVTAPTQVSPGAPAAAGEGLEIVFAPDPTLWDGRFANNAWLQELPNPLSKLSWDNAALVAPATAARLNLANEEVVELRYQGRSVRAPVFILPGQPQDTVLVHLGYGRKRGGKVLEGAGFNAYALRTSDAPWFGAGLEVAKTGESYRLVTSQTHDSIEGRHLARAARIEDFMQNPQVFHEMEEEPVPGLGASGQQPGGEEPPSLYPEVEYNGHAWGMAINLNACLGCNACVLACQAENNIPVVGKEEVENSREMYWLKVDRYFEGSMDNPDVQFQPRLCMHCEHAPCEPVCPTAATVHSSEGLNEMVYSRCVGTRYCSNNCPYKVRRFNFLSYVDENVIPLKLMRNPDVSVRTRGVMEKCTYCVQRISAARIRSEVEGHPIQDGEIRTACQQACPTNAIVFGDINDENSQVRRLKAQPQNYGMLAELGTRPRTSYLGRLRNPNPGLAENA